MYLVLCAQTDFVDQRIFSLRYLSALLLSSYSLKLLILDHLTVTQYPLEGFLKTLFFVNSTQDSASFPVSTTWSLPVTSLML